jgi:hypothetical protein
MVGSVRKSIGEGGYDSYTLPDKFEIIQRVQPPGPNEGEFFIPQKDVGW